MKKTHFAEFKEQTLREILSIGDLLVNSEDLKSIVISSEEQKENIDLNSFDSIYLKSKISNKYNLICSRINNSWVIIKK